MYQFIHIETYARKASTKTKPTNNKYKKKDVGTSSGELSSSQRTTHDTPDSAGSGHGAPVKPRANVAGVLGEVMRDVGYCSHVENPQPPIFLYGDVDKLRGIPDRIERNLQASKLPRRSIRSDTHVLLAGTASFPRTLEQSDPARYAAWKAATLKYLQDKYGATLVCVVEHQDEDHPHLHFYAISDSEPNAKKLHEGYLAASAYPSLSQASKDAYKDAMRDFQTDYYEKVGHSCGLLRDGPRRPRMPREEYKALERSTNERYEHDQRLKHSQELKANELRQVNESNRAFFQERKADLTKQRAELKKGFDSLDKAQREISKKHTEIDAILKDAKLVQSIKTFSNLGLLDGEPGTYVPGHQSPSSPS